MVSHTQCLHPEVTVQEPAQKMLPKLAECSPNINKEEATEVCYEWKIYRERSRRKVYLGSKNDNIKRIYHYWNKVS